MTVELNPPPLSFRSLLVQQKFWIGHFTSTHADPPVRTVRSLSLRGLLVTAFRKKAVRLVHVVHKMLCILPIPVYG